MSEDTPTPLFAGLGAPARERAHEALQALQSGHVEIARRRFERLLKRAPDHPDLLRLAGTAQRLCGHIETAAATLERGSRIAPDDPLMAAGLGRVRLARGDTESGLAELQRACRLAPEVAALWNNLGKALMDCGRVAQAVEPLRRALMLDDKLIQARGSLARALTVSGEIDAAAAEYRALLQQQPQEGDAWIGLAQLKSGALDAADVERMRAVLASDRIEVDNRAAIHYALGAALHDGCDYPGAFAAWSEANRLLRQRQPWDATAFSRAVDRTLDFDWPAPPRPQGPPSVIFIVGLPRSGTTVAERILAAHSRVVAGGERGDLAKVLGDSLQPGGSAWLDKLAHQPAVDWTALGRRYLQGARAGLDRAAVLTDKRPANWLYLGAALNMLPDARVVVCRREPLEVGFSCWRHGFNPGSQLFSHDFGSIGAWWHDFDRACRHWRDACPERVMDLEHAALLAEPEASVRRLLAFCELPFEPACLHPERSAGVVQTLSAAQVRKPLGQAGAPVARHYGTLLDPLRAALAID